MALQDFTNERETWDYISPDTGRATRMITFKQDLGFIILSLLTIVVSRAEAIITCDGTAAEAILGSCLYAWRF